MQLRLNGLWALMATLSVVSCDMDAVDSTTVGIVGGADAHIADYPWQISLLRPDHICGGSILNEEWIMTAAHCVDGRAPTDFQIAAGIEKRSHRSRGQVRNVVEIVVHPNYRDGRLGDYDIALLRLGTPLDLSHPHVSSIGRVRGEHAAAGLTDPGVTASVSGWGWRLYYGGPEFASPDHLQHVSVPIVSNETAIEINGWFRVTHRQIATSTEAGTGACLGDSGGPLVVKDPATGRFLVAGIVSWGYKCANERDEDGIAHPGMYARVSSFEHWIDDILLEFPAWSSSFAFSSPTSTEALKDDTVFRVTADDNNEIARVVFRLPDGRVDAIVEAPFETRWDSTSVLDGTFTVTATAFDAQGVKVAAASTKIIVGNQPNLESTTVLYDFETTSDDWGAFGTGFSTFTEVDTDQPHRGNGAMRFNNTRLHKIAGLLGHFGVRDLTAHKRVRLWAKSPEGDGELIVGFTDEDGEIWSHKEKFKLTKYYQEFQVSLVPNAFEFSDYVSRSDISRNNQIDLDKSRQLNLILQGNATQLENMTFYVDDILLDNTVPEVNQDSSVLFDFETEDSGWIAFGSKDPRVQTSDRANPLVGQASLKYANSAMTRWGGVTYAFDDPMDVSHSIDISFDAMSETDDGEVAFGFQDADGESWITPRVPLTASYQSIQVTLSRGNLALAEAVAIDGAVRNYQPDLNNVRAITFVFFDTNPDADDDVAYYLDNVRAEQVGTRFPNTGTLFDFESEDGNWRPFGASSPASHSARAGEGMIGDGALAYVNPEMKHLGGVTYQLDQPVDLSASTTLSFYARSVTGNGTVALALQDDDGELWQSQGFSMSEIYEQWHVELSAHSFSKTDTAVGSTPNNQPDFDQITRFTIVFFDDSPLDFYNGVTYYIDEITAD